MRNFCSFVLLTVLLATGSPAFAQSAATLSAKDPTVFVGQLREMGYDARIVDTSSVPYARIENNKNPITVAFGGCTDSKGCTYIVLLGSYTDIVNPPSKWLNEKNENYDLMKVWVGDSGALVYSSGLVVEGMPRSTFRTTFEIFINSAADLANAAVKDGLAKRQP